MDDTAFVAAINHAQSAGRDVARPLYEELWAAATRDGDEYRRCVVAHFMAHAQVEPEALFAWHLRALQAADAVHDGRVTAFYPSLYANTADTYLRLDAPAQAQHYIDKARTAEFILQDDGYGRMIRGLIARVAQAVAQEDAPSAAGDDSSHSYRTGSDR